MFEVSAELLEAAYQHAEEQSPKEACGLLVRTEAGIVYHRCRNDHPEPKTFFHLSPVHYAQAMTMGEIIAVVHSHPNGFPDMSVSDLVMMEGTGVPWIVVSPHLRQHTVTEPSGYQAPYTGRPYMWGVTDCYTLVQDYFKGEHGIVLPDMPRIDKFWEKGIDVYREHRERAGFERATGTEIQPSDLLVMQIGPLAKVPNHGAIYLGDGKILHQPSGRKSTIDVYGGYWKKVTVEIFRHREVQR